MANQNYRNVTITMKNGEVITQKKLSEAEWGFVGDGKFFYMQTKSEIVHDGKDYFEEKATGVYYVVADIAKIDSEIVTHIEGRREIFEHKQGKNG